MVYNDDLPIFLGLLTVTVYFLLQRAKLSPVSRSHTFISAGLAVMCIASFLDTALLGSQPLLPFGIHSAGTHSLVVWTGYLPGLALIVAGLAQWMPALARLDREIRRRQAAEEEARRQAVELTEAKLRAELADAAKSRFLAHMSHELRTPLNAILGFSEMLMLQFHGPVGSPHYAAYAEDIHLSGRHLLRVINEVLDLSKIDAGLEVLHEEAFDLDAVAAECERLLQEEYRRVGLALAVDLGSLQVRLRFDRTKLIRILINLLGNALKFTPTGGTVRLHAAALAGGGLQIVVRDSGIGMSPEEVAVALTAFGQANREVRSEGQGSGLGLPIVRALIELHGGALAIDSRPGEGTAVALTVPAARVLGPADEGSAAEAPQMPAD